MQFLSTLISVAQSSSKKAKTAATPATTKEVKQGDGYNIPISLSPYKNTWVYLGCYFGKYKNLADSTFLDDKGQGVFKGKEKLPRGIYFAVSPQKYLLFEFIMDKEQHFSLKADTTKLSEYAVTGSPDNDLFLAYTRYLAQKAPGLNALQTKYNNAKSAKDSAEVRTKLMAGNKELQDYRDNIMTTKPNSILSKFFYAMKRPEVPAVPIVKGKPDSAYPYRFVKDNWWDGVDFGEEALVRTPFFEPKIDEYLKYYVIPDVDSTISDINYLLLISRENKPMFQYLLGKFTDKYINPEFMGQDKVFLFLFDKYYSKGDTLWLTEKQRKYIFDRAYSLKANQLGEPAPELNLLDTSDHPVSLYSTAAPFTFITFWDPNCGHCKETVPRIDSMYNAKWKAQGVKLIGVNIDDAANPAWRKFIVDHKLNGWINMYQPKSVKEEEAKKGVANFRQLYDVYKTPTLYLLDNEKRIIAKMLTIEQFDDILQAKIKKLTSSK